MKRKLTVILSLALIVCLCLTSVPAGAASEAEFTAEEVIYARLGADGTPKEGYAVVALNVSSAGTVTHYGDYSAVVNLSDTTPIGYADNTVTMDTEPGRWYYEGTLSTVELPWNIEISYFLDGEEISPDELGGKSGELEINIRTSKNEAVSGSFYDNYLLQFTITLDSALCENVVVTGGTAANAGSSKTVSLMVLPGSDGDVGLTADVHDFEMSGMTIAAVPYDVADSLGDMSELTDGLDQLVDAISQLNSGASQLSSGASQLQNGASQYGSGLTQLSEGSAQLTAASDQIAAALAQIGSMGGQTPEGGTVSLSALAQLPSALRQLKAGLEQIGAGIDQLNEGYAAAYTALASAIETIPAASVTEEDIGALMAANPDSAALQSLIANYQAAQTVKGTWEQVKAAFSAVQQNLPAFSKSITTVCESLETMASQIEAALTATGGSVDLGSLVQLMSGLEQLAANYAEFNEALKTYTGGVDTLAANWSGIQSGINGLTSGASSLAGGVGTLDEETQAIPDQIDGLLGSGEDESEYVSESFLDERNGEPDSVQFVISTEGIEAPADDAPDEAPQETQGFFARLWNKIVALFS
ncbi:MAG TPA: hypothetical protein IAD42_04760 [Candidatus Scatomorpha pullistercoris]|uniref:Uncharacterized protein n=1 Tax=Candidatus Scatomorpha pullistercoris TaxID=2840929 RepID=A0A9D1G4T4_9FIRM|nr:hypothetical protein [Candidatus Scatomorpha pullistercoris]